MCERLAAAIPNARFVRVPRRLNRSFIHSRNPGAVPGAYTVVAQAICVPCAVPANYQLVTANAAQDTATAGAVEDGLYLPVWDLPSHNICWGP
jgi:hypothetical protein